MKNKYIYITTTAINLKIKPHTFIFFIKYFIYLSLYILLKINIYIFS